MCLAKSPRFIPKRKTGEGWKVFRLGSSFTHSRSRNFLIGEFSEGRRPTGEWLKAENYRGGACVSRSDYKPGFHVFMKYQEAVDYTKREVPSDSIIRKVRYRGAYLMGSIIYRSSYQVIVCREIWISRGEGKPRGEK